MSGPNALLSRAARCLRTAQALRVQASALDAHSDVENAARQRLSARRLEDLAVRLQREAVAATAPGPREATGAWRTGPEGVD